MKKVELTSTFIINAFGKKVFQIRALISFGNVKEGDLGGWVEKEENLSQNGNAWVYGNARVYGNAEVSGNAEVLHNCDWASITGFGSVYRTTTFFRCKDKMIRVSCGCFFGTIDEFKAKVQETHGDSKYADEYLLIAAVMNLHFKEENENGH